MKSKTKKCLLVAGGLAICVVMVVLIGSQFTREVVPDEPITAPVFPAADLIINAGSEQSIVKPDGKELGSETLKDDAPSIVIKPEMPTPIDNSSGNAAVYKGTEQTIQPDAIRPEYDEETLRDPTKTPDGEILDGPPQHVDHEEVTLTPTPAAHTGSKQSGNSSSGNGGGSSGKLPGFDNVPYAGENVATYLDGDGDINKQVGIMG